MEKGIIRIVGLGLCIFTLAVFVLGLILNNNGLTLIGFTTLTIESILNFIITIRKKGKV